MVSVWHGVCVRCRVSKATLHTEQLHSTEGKDRDMGNTEVQEGG